MDFHYIITSILGSLFAIILYLMKNKIENIEKSIKDVNDKSENNSAEIQEFKDNYLDRFEKINNNINKSKIEILEKFHSLEMHMINNKKTR